MAAATKDSFAKTVEGLVRKFDADRDTYLSPGYGEAQARTHFIDPFFRALGWDVENEAGQPYHLCDVWVEKGETEGRPDYAFRIGGQTKFFIEAKAPSVALDNTQHILQTKRYAWNSRDVHFAGLTDFEDFYFFDASLTPDERHPHRGERIRLIYKEYPSQIDLLWELSRDRVAAGSLDQFLAKDRKSIRERKPVDNYFLDELTEWRHDLARSIHTNNPDLDNSLLNEIVQRLLDRIVFLRIAEDRKVMESRELLGTVEWWEEHGGRRSIMEPLVELFREINEDFNGEIFKPHACEQVKVDSAVLAGIIRRLYPPKSPYRFDVIGVELLGSIYERYLGNTLNVTAKQVRLEPKPEVRKAGGVYYTPKYIVDYIVKNTVGKLVEGKTPKEVQKLRILDPACGSGSFLIGAFQYLIDWHLAYYQAHPREARVNPMFPFLVKNGNGRERLSFNEKCGILRHNLYGVDLDPQAVEITMMSLYLKTLEDEHGILGPKHEKLPELKYNIRCANSLIGPDIEKEHPLTPEERGRIRPFDWHSQTEGFGDILKAGGFDAVIGNPPYLSVKRGFFDESEMGYFKARYRTAVGQLDAYELFIERGFSVLRLKGFWSFIIPKPFLSNENMEAARKFLLEESRIERIADCGVPFPEAAVESSVVVANRGTPDLRKPVLIDTLTEASCKTAHEFPLAFLRDTPFNIFVIRANQEDYRLLLRVKKHGIPLAELVEVERGIEAGKKDTSISGKPSRRSKKLLRGEDVEAYRISWTGTYVVPSSENQVKFKSPTIYEVPEKLLLRRVASRPVAAMDDEQFYLLNTLYSIRPKEGDRKKTDLWALMVLLNSRLLAWWFKKTFVFEDKLFPYLRISQISQLPITANSRLLPKISQLGRRLRQVLSNRNSGQERDALLKEANRLVYDLYGLSNEERQRIEADSF